MPTALQGRRVLRMASKKKKMIGLAAIYFDYMSVLSCTVYKFGNRMVFCFDTKFCTTSVIRSMGLHAKQKQ
jgi:hypothetical protein